MPHVEGDKLLRSAPLYLSDALRSLLRFLIVIVVIYYLAGCGGVCMCVDKQVSSGARRGAGRS